MADTVDHTQGDTGTKPPQNRNFQDGGFPDPEEFDWFWSQVPSAINNHASLLESIDSDEDGIVDEATQAANATTVKGNDIDSDGDGKVDSAEVADSAKSYKNNDIDSDGDGVVDSADQAANATTVKGNDIDSNGDGTVDAAETADTATTAITIQTLSSDPASPSDGEIWIVE